MPVKSPQSLSAIPESTEQPAEGDAETFEQVHVHDVYAEIAGHFSATRHTAWPMVVEFLKTLPPDAILLDVGCGNGKYLLAALGGTGRTPCAYAIGIDTCSPLVKLATTAIDPSSCTDVAVADALCLPFRSAFCDAVINIAVVHHLSRRERRVATLRETMRVLRKGGRALVYVWALEREVGATHIRGRSKMMARQFDAQDMLVPWHMRRKKEGAINPRILGDWEDVHRRYYHVYRKGELEDELLQVENIAIVRTYYDHQNWCAIVVKV